MQRQKICRITCNACLSGFLPPAQPECPIRPVWPASQPEQTFRQLFISVACPVYSTPRSSLVSSRLTCSLCVHITSLFRPVTTGVRPTISRRIIFMTRTFEVIKTWIEMFIISFFFFCCFAHPPDWQRNRQKWPDDGRATWPPPCPTVGHTGDSGHEWASMQSFPLRWKHVHICRCSDVFFDDFLP